MSSRTFIILKPDALERGLVDKVMQRFLEVGFVIEHVSYRKIDRTLIYDHYSDVIQREGPGFETWLDEEFVGKAAIPMILTHPREEGIVKARALLGHRRPEQAAKGTIRGDFGMPVLDPNQPAMNLVHASDSKSSFNKEKNLWFQ